MSMRQIRKLQRKARAEEFELEAPQKITLANRTSKYSFNLLMDSSDSSDSSDVEEEVSQKVEERSDSEDSSPDEKQEGSDDSEWERLLNETRENDAKLDLQSTQDFDHFLSSPVHFFKTRDNVGHARSRYSKKGVFETSSRYWLSPGLSTREFMQLRLLASKQFEVELESDPDTGREKFVMNLTDFYREIDDICAAAVHSQDFELFRRLMETHPFHVGILIRASCINTISSNHQEAFTHLDLAVKILQTAMPHRFSLYRKSTLNTPNVWAPSGFGDNSLLYRVLVLYMVSLERKGQWQTGLAVCKLLLAMDFPDDVAHALLHVDMYLLNSFGEKASVSTFVYDYCKLVGLEVPPLFWFLPNFAFTLPLQLYLNQKSSPSDVDHERVRGLLRDLFCLLDEDDKGFMFRPKLTLQDHLELVSRLGEYAPLLLLLRALVQYPLFVVKMSEKSGSAVEVRACASEEPFVASREMEDEDYDFIDNQLVRCYTYKCGDLWGGNNSAFLAQAAGLLLTLYADEEDRGLIESFHALWSAYIMDLDLFKQFKKLSVTEFDLANYSLPSDLESPV